jgi:hypothetical protein
MTFDWLSLNVPSSSCLIFSSGRQEMPKGASHPLDPLQAVLISAHWNPLIAQRKGPKAEGQAGNSYFLFPELKTDGF